MPSERANSIHNGASSLAMRRASLCVVGFLAMPKRSRNWSPREGIGELDGELDGEVGDARKDRLRRLRRGDARSPGLEARRVRSCNLASTLICFPCSDGPADG